MSGSFGSRAGAAVSAILAPIREELLAPSRVQRVAQKMRRRYAERVRDAATRSENAPKELQELDARISRMRARMAAGDPDMAGDELQAAIDRAQAKRQELTNSQTASRQTGKVIAVLPNAAAQYRRQIAEGLDGSPEAAAKARLLRREIFGGTYR